MSGYYIDTVHPGSLESPKIEIHSVAPLAHIDWQPVTNKCSITFMTQKYLVKDGEWMRQLGSDENIQQFRLELSDDMTKRWAYEGAMDPVTGAQLDQISVAGVMTIIKHAFEQGYDAEWTRKFLSNPALLPPTNDQYEDELGAPA